MFAEGRGLYSDNVCLLKAEAVFRQSMLAEGRGFNSDKVCLLKAGGCIQTMYVC